MANDTNYSELSANGLWKNNPALVQLLGLCPLLAVSGSVVNALGLGLATMFVLVCSNTAVSLVRNVVSEAIRLPAFVMIIASSVTCIKLLMQAYAFELYQILGIFIPLIVTNCAILGRADAFACKNKVLPSAYDGFIMVLHWYWPYLAQCAKLSAPALSLRICTCCSARSLRTGRLRCLLTTPVSC